VPSTVTSLNKDGDDVTADFAAQYRLIFSVRSPEFTEGFLCEIGGYHLVYSFLQLGSRCFDLGAGATFKLLEVVNEQIG
jgi:hypothetical protein